VPIHSAYFQLKAVVHHIELHSTTLSNIHVAQVLHDIRHDLLPETPPLPVCVECDIGTRDSDSNSTSQCVPCGKGRFSDETAQTQCEGMCSLGSSIPIEGATSADACSDCLPGQYGESLDGTPMCQHCEPGRFLTEAGASSAQSCIACATGTFSEPGSTSCQSSGCMDRHADNYDPHAVVDEGQCAYTCSTLRASVFSATHTEEEVVEQSGGCLIYDPELGWQRYTPNGTAVSGGTFVDIPSTGLWVLQGRPEPGSTTAHPMYATYVQSTSYANAECAWRYITYTDLVRTKTGIQAGAYANVIVDHTIATGNRAKSAPSWYFSSPSATTGTGSFAISDSVVSFNVARDVSTCCHPPCEWSLPHISSNTVSCLIQEGGGVWLDGAGQTGSLTRVKFEGNEAAKGGGGGLMIHLGATASVTNCEFVANRAPMGGAMHLTSAGTSSGNSAGNIVTVKGSVFRDNSATSQFGGDIMVELSTITIEDCAFFGASAPGMGASLHLNSPASVKILNGTFSPFIDIGTQQTVYLAGRLAGCNEHPCSPGEQCSYLNYSLTCQPCDETSQSSEGLQCTSCGAGTQPNVDRTGCEACVGNTHSEFGMCELCPDSLVVDEDHIGCSDCGVHRTAVAVAGQSSKECGCADGFYDAVDTVHVCFRDGECVLLAPPPFFVRSNLNCACF
jgi:hypothetical protein